MPDQTPTYNLKVVVNETGLTADTLRAWERRYGLPAPERTPGGHRLYSRHDIETLKWLVAKQAEGLTISRAVDLWNELTASGQDPLADAPSPRAAAIVSSHLEDTRSAWVAACLDFNEQTAEQIITQAFALHDVENVCTQILQQGLHEIGSLWYRGKASVQQEHFASELVSRRLNALIAATPAPTRSESVLVANPPKEQHAAIALLVAFFLRRRGLQVTYLGANVPMLHLNETVQSLKPDLALLSAQQLYTAATLRDTVQMLNTHNVTCTYGGRIFNLIPGLRARISAHFLGETIADGILKIEQRLNTRVPYAPVEEPSPSMMRLSTSFALSQAMIDTHVHQQMTKLDFPIHLLETARHFLRENLFAALRLGDIQYLNADMDWLKGMLHHHPEQRSLLMPFLDAYQKAIFKYLGSESEPMVAWFDEQIKTLEG